uniref:Chromosome 8 open reading frame 34 n=1 Tax=Phasianus colchicus TaxID=9054 RepID=A0A669QM51_PHACC
MASHQQTRIQAYLEKNKIGPLFEELMTKLITETPDQPIPFLIDHLQSKQGNRGQLQRTLSGSAALWAESEASENKGTRRDFRSYDKPWQVNAKKPKKSKSDLAVSNISPPSPESKSLPRSIEHPKWDWRTKPENHDFDELNHILQESKKLGKALENLSRSIAISDELDKETTGFNTPLLRPRVIGEWIGREENDADPLAAEMLQPPIPRSKNEQWDSEDSSSPGGSLKMEPKTKGLKQQQQQHKKLLAAMLSQDSFDSAHSTAPSVTEEDIDNEDDAMELLEDLDDLRMEGVTSLMSSGSKFNQSRSAHPAEPQAKVTLNICARCARLQGENMAERPEDVSVVTQTSEPAMSDSDAQVPGVETLMEDIDEFESASQVTASSQPVWTMDAMGVRSGGSPRQKLLKDSLAAKELQTMEKHLADIEKDLALWEEARLSRSPSIQHHSLGTSDPQGNLQATQGQNPRPTQMGKNIQLQGNKSPPLPTNSRAQASSVTNSRPPTAGVQTNRPSTPSTPGSRPVTPNSLLSRPLTPSSQGNKESIISLHRSRSLTSKSQMGRTLSAASGLSVQMSGDVVTVTAQRSSLSEDEFLQQLQLAHQPWMLPSDTESEGVEADQDKHERQ